MTRDTRTCAVLENMMLPALSRGDYRYTKQSVIGKRLGGRNHKVDLFVSTIEGEQIPVSLKWQQSAGTAEQKVPDEILYLANAVRNSRGRFKRAYLVLGGTGWTLRDYYLSGDIHQYLKNCKQVEIISLETFVARANQRKL